MLLLGNFNQQNPSNYLKPYEIQNFNKHSFVKKYLTHLFFSTSVVILSFTGFKFKSFCTYNIDLAGKSLLYKIQNSPKHILLCFFLGISILILAIFNYLHNYHYKNKILSKGVQYSSFVLNNKTNNKSITQNTNKDMNTDIEKQNDKENLNTENSVIKTIENKQDVKNKEQLQQNVVNNNTENKAKTILQIENKQNKSLEIRKKMDLNFKKYFEKYGIKTPKIPSPKNDIYYRSIDLKEYLETLKNFNNEQFEKNKTLGINEEILKEKNSTAEQTIQENTEFYNEQNTPTLEIEKTIYVPKYLKKELETSQKVFRSALNSFIRKEKQGLDITNDTQENIKKRIYLFNFWIQEKGETMNKYTKEAILTFSFENMKNLNDYIPWMFPSSYKSEKYPESVLIRQADVDFYKTSRNARKTYLLMIKKFKKYILDNNGLYCWAERNKEDIYIALKSIIELEGKPTAIKLYNSIMEFIKKHNLDQSQDQNQINKNIQYWNTLFD